MSKRIIAVLKVLVSIVLAGFLLHLVFKNVDWVEFKKKAREVDLIWVFLSIALSTVAYFARAYRWNILLEPLGYNLKTSRTTVAVLVGYLANLAIPRLGEISRCGVLRRNDQVDISHGFGSVVAERIMDLFTLIILIFVSFLVEYARITSFISEAYSDFNVPVYVIYILTALFILGMGAIYYMLKNRDRFKGKFAALISSFLDGLLSLRKIKNVAGFITSTLVIWLIYFFMSYVMVFALSETSNLGLGAGFMLLVTAGIALSIPVQSGFGTYHGMVAAMLFLYGIDKTTGLFFATLLHTSQIGSIAVLEPLA